MYHLTTSTRKFRLACFTLLWLATQRLSFRLVDQSFRSITCSEDFKKEICYIFLVLENFQNRIASEVAVRNVCKNISKSKKCQEILYYLKKDSCSPPAPYPVPARRSAAMWSHNSWGEAERNVSTNIRAAGAIFFGTLWVKVAPQVKIWRIAFCFYVVSVENQRETKCFRSFRPQKSPNP